MTRWKDVKKEQRRKTEEDWDAIVLMDIDSEGNVIKVHTNAVGGSENESLLDAAQEWWRKILSDFYHDPEHVHPIIVEKLNAKSPFSFMVNLKDAPR